MDYEHLGFRNPVASTPTLDSLAAEGTVFDNAWMASRCAPSLASILTGLHPHQHGRTYNYDRTFPLRGFDASASFTQDLTSAGYRCFMAGKWWFGDPTDHGFEASDPDIERFARQDQDELFGWLSALGAEDRFFLWWAPYLPHVPHTPPERHLARIDPGLIVVPEHVPENRRDDYVRDEHALLAMTSWMDEELGRLLDTLDRLGRRDDLLIIFCIDNGWANGLVSKGTVYEKSLQSPIILHHPTRVPAGRTRQELVSITDLRPTILDFAGIEAAPRSEGRSLRPLAELTPGARWRDHLVEMTFAGYSFDTDWTNEAFSIGVRSRSWKYVVYLHDLRAGRNVGYYAIQHLHQPFPRRNRGDEELYLLSQDPHELVNLVDDPRNRGRLRRIRDFVLNYWVQATGF
jgi:uncharacterized sulfatase